MSNNNQQVSKQDFKYLIQLLSCALTGNQTPKPNDDINWASVFYAACKHSVAGMAYWAISKLPKDQAPPEDILAEFLNAYRAELVTESNVEYESEKLFTLFANNSIRFMPLKGYVIKNHYPVPSMRTMSDVDILYKTEDKEKIISVMQLAGYTLKSDTIEQIDFKKAPFHHYELHSSLLRESNKNHDYFSKVWERAQFSEDAPCRAFMKPEDFYIYLLEHMALHIEAGGAGIRMVMDVFVYKNALGSTFDKTYLEAFFLGKV